MEGSDIIEVVLSVESAVATWYETDKVEVENALLLTRLTNQCKKVIVIFCATVNDFLTEK